MNHLWSLEQRISWLVMLHSAEFKSALAQKSRSQWTVFFMFTLNHLWFPEIFQLAEVFAQEFWDWSFQWEISFQQTSWQWLVQYEWFWAHETFILAAQGWNNNPPRLACVQLRKCALCAQPVLASFCQFWPKSASVSVMGKYYNLQGCFSATTGTLEPKETYWEVVKMIRFPSHLPSNANARKLTISIGGIEICPHKG